VGGCKDSGIGIFDFHFQTHRVEIGKFNFYSQTHHFEDFFLQKRGWASIRVWASITDFTVSAYLGMHDIVVHSICRLKLFFHVKE